PRPAPSALRRSMSRKRSLVTTALAVAKSRLVRKRSYLPVADQLRALSTPRSFARVAAAVNAYRLDPCLAVASADRRTLLTSVLPAVCTNPAPAAPDFSPAAGLAARP